MTMHDIRAIGEQDFDAEVLRSPVPVLVDFTAPWCAPCRALAPILHRIAAEGAGALKVVAVDGDEHVSIASRYKVKGFPTVIAFAGGKEIGRRVGVTTKESLLALVEPAVARTA